MKMDYDVDIFENVRLTFSNLFWLFDCVNISSFITLLKHILEYSAPLRTNLNIRTLRSGSQSIHLRLGKLKLQPDQSVNQSLNFHLVRNSVTVEVVIL